MQTVNSQVQRYTCGTGVHGIEEGVSIISIQSVVKKPTHSENMRRRLSAAYHIERSIAHRMGLPEYPCACNRCRGAIIKKVETVARHHSAYGRDPYLVYPVMVGNYIDMSLTFERPFKLLLGNAQICIILWWMSHEHLLLSHIAFIDGALKLSF